MLMRILKRLSQGGVYSNKSMSRELGIDESLVEQMVSQLQNMRYIEKDSLQSCSNGCGGCCSEKSKSCCSNHNIDLNLWKLTDKGKNALMKQN